MKLIVIENVKQNKEENEIDLFFKNFLKSIKENNLDVRDIVLCYSLRDNKDDEDSYSFNFKSLNGNLSRNLGLLDLVKYKMLHDSII